MVCRFEATETLSGDFRYQEICSPLFRIFHEIKMLNWFTI